MEALRRAGRQLNRKKFISAIESIRNYDLGIDNPLSFGADDHQGLDRVYFTMIRDGGFELITDWHKVAAFQAKQKGERSGDNHETAFK